MIGAVKSLSQLSAKFLPGIRDRLATLRTSICHQCFLVPRFGWQILSWGSHSGTESDSGSTKPGFCIVKIAMYLAPTTESRAPPARVGFRFLTRREQVTGCLHSSR